MIIANDKLKLMCSYLGGSALYSLETPTSDVDKRGVFINTEPSFILGLNRFDSQVKNTTEEDSCYFEIRHFMSLLNRLIPKH